jgi:hypothetical protein
MTCGYDFWHITACGEDGMVAARVRQSQAITYPSTEGGPGMAGANLKRGVRSAVIGLALILCLSGFDVLSPGFSLPVSQIKQPQGWTQNIPHDGGPGFFIEAQEKPPAQQEEKLAEQVYKNIQVFKGVPASRLMPGMTRLTEFLGVDCTHCHLPNQFESDDKVTKQTARKMFQLVRLASREINTNRVTCYTCHRGHPQPERQPESMLPSEEERKKAEADKRPAEQVYKNVQTLRGVPAGRWTMIMTMFTKSLGVDCNHCHVPGEFEKDDKPAKQMARKMLRMTGAIAREIYQGPTSINCYTCHRGQSQPASLPPAAPAAQPKFEEKPPEVKSSASLPALDQVLDRYLQALGGKAALEKVTTRAMKGALVTQGGMSAPLEIYEKAPNKTFTTFRTPSGATLMAFNGAAGWTQTPERGLRDQTGAELAWVKNEAEFYKELKLKERYPKMMLLGTANLGDRETYVIEAMPVEGLPQKFYFDRQSGLLLRQDLTLESPQGKTPLQIYFEDYREVAGIKRPFVIRRSRPDFTWSYKFDEVKLNVPVDDAKFNKPAGKQ